MFLFKVYVGTLTSTENGNDFQFKVWKTSNVHLTFHLMMKQLLFFENVFKI